MRVRVCKGREKKSFGDEKVREKVVVEVQKNSMKVIC